MRREVRATANRLANFDDAPAPAARRPSPPAPASSGALEIFLADEVPDN